MGTGKGFGKVILFGEHFVVHGIPGIVSATDLATVSNVMKGHSGIAVKDERKGTEGYSEKKKLQQQESIESMLDMMGIKERSFEIYLGGDLPVFSGIGASAASSVAIARAMASELKLNFSDEKINQIAYEAEKAYAGTPSGIDNTAATYGGLLWFKKGEPNTVERIKVKKPFEIVLCNTGVVADTKAAVEGVRERKNKNPQKYNPIFQKAEKLVYEARKAIESSDLSRVGKLMDENHMFLQEIEVSCKELDYLVKLAKKNGAMGAKLTGGGLGGCMVALTPGKQVQDRVANAMENEGFQLLKLKVGV